VAAPSACLSLETAAARPQSSSMIPRHVASSTDDYSLLKFLSSAPVLHYAPLMLSVVSCSHDSHHAFFGIE
jgi:hypothetical protein